MKTEVEESKKSKINKKNLIEFIKSNISQKAIVLCIIGIISMLLITLTLNLSNVNVLDGIETTSNNSVLSILKERVIIILLIFLAGYVPYFYIPVIAYIAYIFMLSGDLVIHMKAGSVIIGLLINIIPTFIDITSISILVAIGIYMCNLVSKKYKYAQRTSFSILDVKMQYYEALKKQDKYEETLQKKQNKIEKMEKNNVKIDYQHTLCVFGIAAITNLVICTVTALIN